MKTQFIGFQSTLPAGEATTRVYHYFIKARFQSTLPAGEATVLSTTILPVSHISIHASRGGSDLCLGYNRSCCPYFNPRFPRGKRLSHVCICNLLPNFNPRFPRGKRQCANGGSDSRKHFNPRFPRGKRPPRALCNMGRLYISIHASRGGSDLLDRCRPGLQNHFNPRFPRGKRLCIRNTGC